LEENKNETASVIQENGDQTTDNRGDEDVAEDKSSEEKIEDDADPGKITFSSNFDPWAFISKQGKKKNKRKHN